MTRSSLRKLVALMFSVLLAAFIFVLIGGWRLEGFGSNGNSSGSLTEFSDVAIGQTLLRRYQSKRVWVSRLADTQRRQLASINPFLLEPSSGCPSNATLCVLLAVSPTQSFDLSYSLAPPPQLPSDTPWHGGFVDPTTGVVYDLLGRVYRIAGHGKWNRIGADYQNQLALQVIESR